MSRYQFYKKTPEVIIVNKQKDQWQYHALGTAMGRKVQHLKLNRTLDKLVTVKLLWATVFLLLKVEYNELKSFFQYRYYMNLSG